MEARDLAETLKDRIERQEHLDELEPLDVEVTWGYGDADFFVKTDDEGTFLVSVVKVAE